MSTECACLPWGARRNSFAAGDANGHRARRAAGGTSSQPHARGTDSVLHHDHHRHDCGLGSGRGDRRCCCRCRVLRGGAQLHREKRPGSSSSAYTPVSPPASAAGSRPTRPSPPRCCGPTSKARRSCPHREQWAPPAGGVPPVEARAHIWGRGSSARTATTPPAAQQLAVGEWTRYGPTLTSPPVWSATTMDDWLCDQTNEPVRLSVTACSQGREWTVPLELPVAIEGASGRPPLRPCPSRPGVRAPARHRFRPRRPLGRGGNISSISAYKSSSTISMRPSAEFGHLRSPQRRMRKNRHLPGIIGHSVALNGCEI
jgi:hypothetical protein